MVNVLNTERPYFMQAQVAYNVKATCCSIKKMFIIDIRKSGLDFIIFVLYFIMNEDPLNTTQVRYCLLCNKCQLFRPHTVVKPRDKCIPKQLQCT